MLIRDTLLRDTNLISITYFNQNGEHTPFDRRSRYVLKTEGEKMNTYYTYRLFNKC